MFPARGLVLGQMWGRQRCRSMPASSSKPIGARLLLPTTWSAAGPAFSINAPVSSLLWAFGKKITAVLVSADRLASFTLDTSQARWVWLKSFLTCAGLAGFARMTLIQIATIQIAEALVALDHDRQIGLALKENPRAGRKSQCRSANTGGADGAGGRQGDAYARGDLAVIRPAWLDPALPRFCGRPPLE